MDATREKYLSTKEAAERIGVHPQTIRNIVLRGGLQKYQPLVGKGFIFKAQDVDRIKNELQPRSI